MRRRGPTHGVRQRQTPAYNPASGKPLSASAYLPPDVAVKLARAVPSVTYDAESDDSLQVSVKLPPAPGAKAWLAASAADLSISGLLSELVRQMPVDEEGRPAWQQPSGSDSQLPLDVPPGSRSRLSVNGLLRELVERMPVDGSWRPMWASSAVPMRQMAIQLAHHSVSAA